MTFSIARRLLGAIAALGTALALTGCGYNDFQRLDESTKSAWSDSFQIPPSSTGAR